MTTTPNLTANEKTVLRNWFDHTCRAMGGKTVDDIRADNFSWADVDDVRGDLTFESARGVCGNLTLKGLVGVDVGDRDKPSALYLTDAGLDALDAILSGAADRQAGEVEVWNTGCLYTASGQRIAAQRVGDRVCFVDLDRGIDGEFDANNLPMKLRDQVMARYLHNQYDPWIRDRDLCGRLTDAAATAPSLKR